MARKPDPDARRRILATACRLFDEHGVRAVGLQQVIDACGCGKNLLYREFGSKDELVLAWLETSAQEWTRLLANAAADAPDDPAEQLVALVRLAVSPLDAPWFRGCPLHNAHAEFPDQDHPTHRYVVEHYAGRLRDLHALASRAGAPDPTGLAHRVALVLDGANANGAVLGSTGAADVAVDLAREVVHGALAATRA